MRKKKLLEEFLLCIVVIAFVPAILYQKEQTPVEIISSNADFIIESDDKSEFGTGVFILDMNNDGINDYVVVQGHGFFDLRSTPFCSKNKLYIFDGRTVNQEKRIKTSKAKIVLSLPSKWFIWRGKGISQEGFWTGDFNGDGCEDILVATKDDTSRLTWDFPSDFILYLILGSKDIFTKHGVGPYESEYQTIDKIKIYAESDDSKTDYLSTELGERLFFDLAFFDINGDNRDDILVTFPQATVEKNSKLKIKKAGKILILYGKESPPTEINLSKEADIIIGGDQEEAGLGQFFHMEKQFDDNKNFINTELWVGERGKIRCFPNIQNLVGNHLVSEITEGVHFIGCASALERKDVDGDKQNDLIIISDFSDFIPFYDNSIKTLKKYDPVRHKEYLEDQKYTLVSVIYGKEGKSIVGQHINDVADLILSFKPDKNTNEMKLVNVSDLDGDGTADFVFRKKIKISSSEEETQHLFIYNFPKDDKIAFLEKTVDFSIQAPSGSWFVPSYSLLNLNGNSIPDFIAYEPFSDGRPDQSSKKAKKECGRIHVYFDKYLNKESLSTYKESANLVIYGEQEKELFGRWVGIADIDKDGLDDIVVKSYEKDVLVDGKKKAKRGGVYIFLGKSL